MSAFSSRALDWSLNQRRLPTIDRAVPSAIDGILFLEDLDEPEPELQIEAPRRDQAEERAATFAAGHRAGLAEGLEAGRAQGHAAGLEAAEAENGAAIRATIGAVTAAMSIATANIAVLDSERTYAAARLVLDTVRVLFPALSARHGDQEVVALVDALRPMLPAGAVPVIRAAPAACAMVSAADPMLRTLADDAMPPGDVRVTWEDGQAIRSSADLWRQIAAILDPSPKDPPDDR